MAVSCKNCKGEGKIPFVKNGKVIPYTWVFCDCHPQYGVDVRGSIPLATEGRRPGIRGKITRGRMHLYEDDFDFPMSYDFYRSLCLEHGWQDPGSNYPQVSEQQPQVIEHIHFHSNLSKKEWDEMEQTRLRTLHLQRELKELQDKIKVDKQYKYE